jgi:hypothetical protein
MISENNLRPSTCPHCGSGNLVTEPKGPHVGLYCKSCGAWIKWLAHKPIACMPFGAHKGKAITELPDEYLNWILENLELRRSLRTALETEFERRGSAWIIGRA